MPYLERNQTRRSATTAMSSACSPDPPRRLSRRLQKASRSGSTSAAQAASARIPSSMSASRRSISPSV